MSTPSAENPGIVALADQCVKCGLCLPHCPTYRLDRRESESPRGRIALAAALEQLLGEASPPTDKRSALAALDHCVGCRACERVCPAQVQYGELLWRTRALQRRSTGASTQQRLVEWLCARPRLLSLLLSWGHPLRRLLPMPWRAVFAAPRQGALPWGLHRAADHKRGRVALFLGCVARRADADVQRAAVTVLTRLGWDVDLPATQGCCGSLHAHGGARQAAVALAATLHRQLALDDYDALLVSASGCFEAVRDAFPQRPRWVCELLEFAAADPGIAELPLRSSTALVALQVPCTQRNVVQAATVAENLLLRIPGIRLTRLPEQCCGAAGTHMLLFPQRAAALRQPLIDAMVADGADVVASGNIGCRLHLQAGFDSSSRRRFVHPIELIAEHLQ